MTGADGIGKERFCGEECLNFGVAEAAKGGGLRERVEKALHSTFCKMNKLNAKFSTRVGLPADGELGVSQEITPATLDTAWAAAACDAVTLIQLDEMELEIARFVSSALVHLYIDSTSKGLIAGRGQFPSILELQQNELPHTIQRPYILHTHIRIYQFLRAALWSILELRPYISLNQEGKGWVRQILSRDAGNSFGIWEQTNDNDEESDMFGWGIWTDASFFNHSKPLFSWFHPV
jgi:SET and MYND domain-containing protein